MRSHIIILAAVVFIGCFGLPCFADLPADMVNIPAGQFQMGDSFSEGLENELPVHTVTLDSFAIGKYEVTTGQYCQYLNSAGDSIYVYDGTVYGRGSNKIYFDTYRSNPDSQIDYSDGVFTVKANLSRDISNDPVVWVSWYGAAAYCNWRCRREGYETCYDTNDPNWQCGFSKKGFRLPTEAEWEYAARGGLSGKRFPLGDTISHAQANYFAASLYSYDISATIDFHPDWGKGVFPRTSAAGSFPPNGYGVYDAVGNVWEWCNDWYCGSYYNRSEPKNPTGPSSGIYRVARGGGWLTRAFNCRVARRDSYSPDVRAYGFGFRVVLDTD